MIRNSGNVKAKSLTAQPKINSHLIGAAAFLSPRSLGLLSCCEESELSPQVIGNSKWFAPHLASLIEFDLPVEIEQQWAELNYIHFILFCLELSSVGWQKKTRLAKYNTSDRLALGCQQTDVVFCTSYVNSQVEIQFANIWRPESINTLE